MVTAVCINLVSNFKYYKYMVADLGIPPSPIKFFWLVIMHVIIS